MEEKRITENNETSKERNVEKGRTKPNIDKKRNEIESDEEIEHVIGRQVAHVKIEGRSLQETGYRR
jgi:hypothetical protein